LRGGVGVENALGSFSPPSPTKSGFQPFLVANRPAQILKSLTGLDFRDSGFAGIDKFLEFDGMIKLIRANEPRKSNRFRVLSPGGCNST